MTQPPIKKPKLPSAYADDGAPDGVLEPERIYEALHWIDRDHSYQEADNLEIRRSLLQRVNWSGAVLRKIQVSDARFQECDLSNADWGDGGAQRVEMAGCRMTGFRAEDAFFRDLRWDECSASFSHFHQARFKGAHFEGCNFRDADFYGADLTGVVFHNCDLTRARFTEAVCVDTDFRTSTIDELVIGVREWRGAILDPFQTVVLASLLGVQVRTD
ncbi:hypothetical protein CCAX7_17410 [Capsulimonas corticalis]|uniref:Uncharacterized protein n=1 Tax=Capsulimonas corticalis TaxID=2219043 RepID=A0A402D3Z7_9BACT|nr:pentapeptide repeat-containing protein [Capsulimonas corticalis]BDI29690.1 hypothetical protein CCAX7_17410 [Capsulimonas corticalis]